MDTLRLSPPQRDLMHARASVSLFMAGQGSGKTFTLALVALRFLEKFPHLHGFIAANTYMQLTDSTLKGVFKAWSLMGLEAYDPAEKSGDYVWDKKPPKDFSTEGHYFRDYRNKVCFRSGAVVFIGSLENYKAHDGKEFAWALLDETKDTKEAAIREVILGRLRQKGLYVSPKGNWVKHPSKGSKALNPLYVFTSPAKVSWINTWFELGKHHKAIVAKIFSERDYFHLADRKKAVVISSTYLNQRNLPEGFVDNMKENLPSHLQDMLIYGSPFAKSGGEFYKSFDREKHVEDLGDSYRKEQALLLSFDFNVAPYITLTVWQTLANGGLGQLREFCLSSPNNTLFALCQAFKRAYPAHQGGLVVFGDPSGNQRNVFFKGTPYDIIHNELSGYGLRLALFKAAPALIQRNIFINALLAEELREAPAIRFDKSCQQTIADYQFLKETAEGGKLKEKAQDSETGISYEKYGHTSDANDYLLCKFLENHFLKVFGKQPGNYRLGKRRSRSGF